MIRTVYTHEDREDEVEWVMESDGNDWEWVAHVTQYINISMDEY